MDVQSGGGVTMRLEGTEKVVLSLSRLADKGERLGMMEGIGAYGVSSTQQRFNDGVGPSGEKWKPSIRAKEAGGKTMVNTASLYQSFNFHAGTEAVEWGTNKIYAAIHQEGGIITAKNKKSLAFSLANGNFVLKKSVKIPARPFVGLSVRDGKRIEEIAAAFLGGLV